ncbi:hypothetical protein C7W88_19395 (plasmid) [Novosphingobium sp. THN1]|uniref:hypothetical protein n=1 Tax=Novosphingobium sp. THN1 TaxID=1016987 RepID=UPI000E47CAD2|nr:hypothetical protein [Novosphingobium sp. THN1]AXU21126.1 hypothetical protein C7W88_19395 [Novosphingobium sp. THN1]
MLDWFETQAPIREKMRVLTLALVGAAALNLFDIPVLLLHPEHSLALVSVVAVISLVLTFTILRLASERICRPYVDTVVRMEALAEGDTESPIRYTHHADCVGRMTKAMDKFRVSIRASTDLETQRRIIDRMNSSLARLAANDLTAEVNEAFPASTRKCAATSTLG